MNRIWRAVGIAGGVLGAAVGAGAVGAATQTRRIKNQRADGAGTDPFGDEPLGELRPTRTSTVAADDGTPLAVEEVDPADGGKAELTVVLVHGYVLDRRCWHFQRRDLAELVDPRVRLVLYDQRSHGRSGRSNRENSTIEQLGHDLASVLRALAPEGPLVLIGHSMGGMTIMALAEQEPELFVKRVRGVALIGTAAGKVGSSGLPRPVLSRYNPVTLGLGKVAGALPNVVERVRGMGGQIIWAAVRRLAFGDREVSPALVDFMDRMIDGTPVEVITDFLSTLETHNRYAALAGLRHCTVLVLGGDADRLTPYSHSEAIAAELPDAELVRAPDAGHMVMLEQADLVTGKLAELIRRCASGGTGKRWWRKA
ncbi:pimeloyl-ACP methyl ester carboxylesterase [Crossiella equi]|uniref:Pimeloyl-ACP methyl ester carboxylesterase n=1 Tax=Crossiella equi TaxID=130796 RepID=A0ABS5AI15_9PSEU|nr:alpha/beta hydrolase [Crossiella equi]MBP2476210.1 pimeloyl-ACP methyl ester carboxylesterase [Crossiella equi]